MGRPGQIEWKNNNFEELIHNTMIQILNFFKNSKAHKFNTKNGQKITSFGPILDFWNEARFARNVE